MSQMKYYLTVVLRDSDIYFCVALRYVGCWSLKRPAGSVQA